MLMPEASLPVLFMAILITVPGNKAMAKSPNHAVIGATGETNKEKAPAANDFVTQDPRFAGIRKGQSIRISCGCPWIQPSNTTFTWFLGNQDGSFLSYVLDTDPSMEIQGHWLIIHKVQLKHSGVYFCNFTNNGAKGVPCGTELMVLGSGNQASARSRNTMKDAIIMIQTVLIVLFITVPIILLMEMKKKRSIKMEDHTYEGLEAYQVATYEDIQTVQVLAAKTMEGEHPCVE